MLRKLAAEGLGTTFLLATIVGSGIMAAKLAGGNTAIALLGNTIPTGAILVVLISTLGPISGAHFNPLVSLTSLVNRSMTAKEAAAYIAAQFIGAILGTIIAHAMFDLPLLQASTTMRSGTAQWVAEVVASFGLLTVIFLVRFPASWNQLAEKESHQINNLEQILVAKVFNFCGICSKCPECPATGGHECRPLHHRRLLVHRVHQLCQSRRHLGAFILRYLRRDKA